MLSVRLFAILLSVYGILLGNSQSQDLLRDRNGDGLVSVLAIGDSITYGIGDGFGPAEELVALPPYAIPPTGYPGRLEQLLSVSVGNSGVPGELLTTSGVLRIPGTISQSSADLVLLAWGSNDAFLQTSPSVFRRALQKTVNTVRSFGKEPVLLTTPIACCDRIGLDFYTAEYSGEIRRLASWNRIAFVDLEQLWKVRCPEIDQCPLLNKPEGLHPNTLGYDFISLGVAATILQIPLNQPSDAVKLADALGLEVTYISDLIFGAPQTTALSRHQ